MSLTAIKAIIDDLAVVGIQYLTTDFHNISIHNTPLDWKCSEGHLFKETCANLKGVTSNRSGCPTCKGMAKEAFREVSEPPPLLALRAARALRTHFVRLNPSFLPKVNGIQTCLKIGETAIDFRELRKHSFDPQSKHNKPQTDRRLHCEAQGVELITIFEDEWLTNRPLVLRLLEHRFGMNVQTLHGCPYYRVGQLEHERFLQRHTIPTKYPSGRARTAIFAMHHPKKSELVGTVAISVKGSEASISITPNLRYNVVGLVEGLFKKAEVWCQEHSISKIVVGEDLRYSGGAIWPKLGFTHSIDTDPFGWYTDGHTRTFPKLNEKADGRLVIFDCGWRFWTYEVGKTVE